MTESTRGRVLSSEQVRLSAQPVRVGGRTAANGDDGADAPGVQEVRNAAGDIVEIHVRCACGDVTVIACDYAA